MAVKKCWEEVKIEERLSGALSLLLYSVAACNFHLTERTLRGVSVLRESLNSVVLLSDQQKKVVDELTSFVSVVDSINMKKTEDAAYINKFNPFLGTPPDMLKVSVENGGQGHDSLTFLVMGTEFFLERIYKTSIKKVVSSYMNEWLKMLIDLVACNIHRILDDKEKGAISLLLCRKGQ